MRYTIRFYDQKKPDQWEFSLSGFPEKDLLYDTIKTMVNEHVVYVSYETDTDYRYKQAVFSTSFGDVCGFKDSIGLNVQFESDHEFLEVYLTIKSNGLHVGSAEYLNRKTREKKHVKFIEFYTRVEREDTMSVQGRKPEKSIQMI